MSALRRALRAARRDEGGFTLAELTVVMGVLSLLLTIVGTILIGLMLTGTSVAAQTTTTSQAQSAAETLDARIRNAAELRLTTVNTTDQLLVARVASQGATATYRCHGWYYDAARDRLLERDWAVAGSTALPTSSSTSQLAGWSVTLEGVAPPAGSSVFTRDGGAVTLALLVDAGDRNQPQELRTTVAMYGEPGGGATCWD